MSTEPSPGRPRSPRWRIERTLADELSDPLLDHDRLLIAIATAFGTAPASLTARTPDRYWTVLTADAYFAPIAYGAPRTTLDPSQLRACCPRELSYAMLTAIARRAPAEVAASAARVSSVLPLQPHDDTEGR